MAAQAWKVFPKAKRNIANGACTLTNASTAFNIMLMKSTSNCSTSAALLEHKSSITNECASVANAYSTSGKALGAVVWTMSGNNVKFDASNVIWTACGNPIGSIMYAVIFQSGASNGACHLLCYCSLTSTATALATNNTLEIQMASGGIFTLS